MVSGNTGDSEHEDMGQKEEIINLLNNNTSMTQGQLSEAIYCDKNHSSNIYAALSKLVIDGIVIRICGNPAYYALSNKYCIDVTKELITDETLDEAERAVMRTDNYGPEMDMITRCLKKYPYNTDADLVAMKIGLIDITNSTHLSQHKSKISMVDLSNIISSIPDIDERIKAGDPEVVNSIAHSNDKINLFSFATKYCCYHNKNLYERDDYSILDTVLKESLPKYFDDITRGQIQRWQDSCNYAAYNDYITKKLDELNITTDFRKRKFDWFVWYKNRKA